MSFKQFLEESKKPRGAVQLDIMSIVDGMKKGEQLDVSSNKELLDKHGISKLMNAGADLGKKGIVNWDGSNFITVK